MTQPSNGFLRSNAAHLGRAMRFVDALLLGGGLAVATIVYSVPWETKYSLAATLAILIFLVAAEMSGLYASWRLYPLRQELAAILVTLVITGASLVLIWFFAKVSANYSRAVLVLWGSASFGLLLLSRVILRLALRRLRVGGRNSRQLAIAGIGEAALRVARQVDESEWLGLSVSGFYEDGAVVGKPLAEGQDWTVQGSLADLVDAARKGRVDYVYIAVPISEERRIAELIQALSDTTVSVYFIPDFFLFELLQARWTMIEGVPAVSLFETPFEGISGAVKRFEDIILSILILGIVALPMLAIAIGVKVSSPGPAFFKQRRYGLSGKVVEVWKFRSMTVCEDGGEIPQAIRNDPRVTRFGEFLRRTSLDELPQFFNVLAGEMSIVGPRPHAVAHNEQYRKLIPGYMLRHKVKPGITGWAQVNGWRGETEVLEKMEKRIEHDLDYIRNWSLWLDLKIIGMTILRGFRDRRAY